MAKAVAGPVPQISDRLAGRRSVELSPQVVGADGRDCRYCPKRSRPIGVGYDAKMPAAGEGQAATRPAWRVRRPAQSVTSGAMRIPPASIQLASQLPDLVENLATATERLNNAVDRTERYIALAERMLWTMDALLPQVEALVVTGNELYNAVSSVPGVSTPGRLATRSSNPPPRKKPPKGRITQRES